MAKQNAHCYSLHQKNTDQQLFTGKKNFLKISELGGDVETLSQGTKTEKSCVRRLRAAVSLGLHCPSLKPAQCHTERDILSPVGKRAQNRHLASLNFRAFPRKHTPTSPHREHRGTWHGQTTWSHLGTKKGGGPYSDQCVQHNGGPASLLASQLPIRESCHRIDGPIWPGSRVNSSAHLGSQTSGLAAEPSLLPYPRREPVSSSTQLQRSG